MPITFVEMEKILNVARFIPLNYENKPYEFNGIFSLKEETFPSSSSLKSSGDFPLWNPGKETRKWNMTDRLCTLEVGTWQICGSFQSATDKKDWLTHFAIPQSVTIAGDPQI